jgi:hypothetical protein
VRAFTPTGVVGTPTVKGRKCVVKALTKSKWAGKKVDTVIIELENGVQTAMEITEWRKRYAP